MKNTVTSDGVSVHDV